MVDYERAAEENVFMPQEASLASEYFNVRSRTASCAEEAKEISKEQFEPMREFFRSVSLRDVKTLSKESRHINCDQLSLISAELLSRSPERYRSASSAQKIENLLRTYKNVMEKFLVKTEEFMLSVWKMRDKLIRSLQEFRMISRSTAQVIVVSSIANTVVVLGSLMQKFFRFSWSPRVFLLPSITGALSFTTSLLAFSYMKRTTNEFSSDLRRLSRLLLDLTTAHRKGDWVDAEVSKLFPHGIDVNCIDERALEQRNYFKTKYLWKRYLCTAIMLHNINKDIKLMKDEEFLIRVKLFVENPAAEIWWSRIQIKKLLREVHQKTDPTSAKKFLSYHEDIIYRTALYVYPILIPWLISSRTTEEMKFICTSLAGILAAMDLGNDGSEELLKLREMYLNFEKGFREIYKISDILDNGED